MTARDSEADVAGLVEQHYELLYRIAYRLSGSAADAEDLTQETFCVAQAKFRQLRDPASAKGWLCKILRNCYLRSVRDAHVVLPLDPEEPVEAHEGPDSSLPEIEPERLQEALNALPEEFRTPLILFYFEDFSYRQIADQMGVPIGTVMSRLARAKQHLRRCLAPARIEA